MRKPVESDEDSDEVPEAKTEAMKKKPVSSDSDDGAEVDPKKYEVFVGGLPFSVDEDTLRKDFTECGQIQRLSMPMADGRSRGIAFITFADKKGVDAALKYNDTDYGGRYIKVSMAGDRPPKGEGKGGKGGKDGKGGKSGRDPSERDQVTVFVGGLPYTVDEETLRKDFEECGEIERLRLPLNEEGTPKGFAFIEYKSKEAVEKAVKFDGTDYGGRWIKVNCAADRPKEGKDGKKGKDKGGKGDKKGGKGKAPNMAAKKQHGGMVESEGTKQTFADSASDDES